MKAAAMPLSLYPYLPSTAGSSHPHIILCSVPTRFERTDPPEVDSRVTLA